MISGDELQRVANTQGRGHLKWWKAEGMVRTLRELPIADDDERLSRFVANCLRMEGFSDDGIAAVVDAIKANPPAADDRG